MSRKEEEVMCAFLTCNIRFQCSIFCVFSYEVKTMRSLQDLKKTLHLKFLLRSCSVSIFAAWFDGHFSPK